MKRLMKINETENHKCGLYPHPKTHLRNKFLRVSYFIFGTELKTVVPFVYRFVLLDTVKMLMRIFIHVLHNIEFDIF